MLMPARRAATKTVGYGIEEAGDGPSNDWGRRKRAAPPASLPKSEARSVFVINDTIALISRPDSMVNAIIRSAKNKLPTAQTVS